MQTKPDIVPIFIMGSARNGTTWLGNSLCAHPEVVGAQHVVHWGQKESKIYSCWKYAGDLTDDYKFIQFIELYSSTDYFQLVDGDKEFFYRNRPKNFFDLYLTLMDQYAMKQNVRYWVTKLDPRFYEHPRDFKLFLGHLEERYPLCRFVGIRRAFSQVLRSYLGMEGQNSIHKMTSPQKHLAALLESARYVIHYKGISEVIAEKNGLLLEFEEFKSDHERCLQKICSYLGADFTPEMLSNRYKAKSSLLHKSGTSETSEFTFRTASKFYIRLFSIFWPAAMLLLRLWGLFKRDACPLDWRLLKLQYMKESFSNELIRTGQVALHQLIFEDTDDN